MENRQSSSYPPKSNVKLQSFPHINPRLVNYVPNPVKVNTSLNTHSSIRDLISFLQFQRRFEQTGNYWCIPEFVPSNPRQEIMFNAANGQFIKPACSSDAIRAQNLKPIPEASVRSTDFREFFPDRKNRKELGKSGEGKVKKAANSKSLLSGICTSNKWNPPLYECCKEEGPGHAKVFTFKVIVEMKGASNTVLESYGAPQTRKKVAEEHSAEGALWYLKHLGFVSKG